MLRDFQKLALVLHRISSNVRHEDLRKKLESATFSILEAHSLNQWHQLCSHLNLLSNFIKFGKSIYQIEPVNSDMLLGYIDNLQSEIKAKKMIDESRDIPDLIRKLPGFNGQTANTTSGTISGNKPNQENTNFNSSGNSNNHENEGGNGNGVPALVRQQYILNIARQSNNSEIRLKDIASEFPEVTERTLRYDLQRLCQQGDLEKVGNGGPSTFYVIKGAK